MNQDLLSDTDMAPIDDKQVLGPTDPSSAQVLKTKVQRLLVKNKLTTRKVQRLLVKNRQLKITIRNLESTIRKLLRERSAKRPDDTIDHIIDVAHG